MKPMTDAAWLRAHQRAIIQKALTEHTGAARTEMGAIKTLADILRDAKPYPDLTAGPIGRCSPMDDWKSIPDPRLR
jgi:hypothetical protein